MRDRGAEAAARLRLGRQDGGVAHIPIDEAKKLMLERGLPVREGEAAAPTLGTQRRAVGEASGGRMMRAGAAAPAAAPHRQPHAPAQPGTHRAGDAPAAKPHGPGRTLTP